MQDQLPFAGGSQIVWGFAQAGLLDELVAVTGALRRTPWLEAADAVLGGDWDAAAAIYARCVSPPDEAFARLQAGGDANLRAARDFFRSVNASKYVREAEARLTATA